MEPTTKVIDIFNKYGVGESDYWNCFFHISYKASVVDLQNNSYSNSLWVIGLETDKIRRALYAYKRAFLVFCS